MTEDRIAGSGCFMGQCNVTLTSREHCNWLH